MLKPARLSDCLIASTSSRCWMISLSIPDKLLSNGLEPLIVLRNFSSFSIKFSIASPTLFRRATVIVLASPELRPLVMNSFLIFWYSKLALFARLVACTSLSSSLTRVAEPLACSLDSCTSALLALALASIALAAAASALA